MTPPFVHNCLVAISLLCATTPAFSGQIQDAVKETVVAGLPVGQEEVDIIVEDTLLQNDCPSPVASLPYAIPERGGRVSVAVSCAGASAKYIRVQVKMMISYVQVNQDVERGQEITRNMLRMVTSDRATLPSNVIINTDDVIGQQATRNIKVGSYIQTSSLREVKLIDRNAKVSVIAQGNGFSVRHDGIALDAGSKGTQIRVRLIGGKVIRGSVADKNTVEISL